MEKKDNINGDYINDIKALYGDNNMFNFVMQACILTEKRFGNILCGEDKRSVLVRCIKLINHDKPIDEDLLDSIIDFIFYIRNNTKLLKALGKRCKGCNCA